MEKIRNSLRPFEQQEQQQQLLQLQQQQQRLQQQQQQLAENGLDEVGKKNPVIARDQNMPAS